MRFKKKLPSVETLHEWFSCDFDTGKLYWKNPRGPRVKAGDPVYSQPGPYAKIKLQVNYKEHVFLVHRVIWKMYYREDLGQQELDHIDGNKWNNAISNLRVATPTQNQHNRSHAKGFKRSNYHKGRHCSTGGWEVRIQHDGVQKHYGTYSCPLLARLAYIDFKRQIAKEFSPV